MLSSRSNRTELANDIGHWDSGLGGTRTEIECWQGLIWLSLLQGFLGFLALSTNANVSRTIWPCPLPDE